MTSEPSTPRPLAADLIAGAKLRVQWSEGWWAAEVKEVAASRVRIGYESWPSSHDEWLPFDSERMRMAPTDFEKVGAVHAGSDALRAQLAAAPVDTMPISSRIKPFTPKPYNPEKEFQKRQLRVKEKVARMQKERLGAVDPTLEHAASLQPVAAASLTGAPQTSWDKPPQQQAAASAPATSPPAATAAGTAAAASAAPAAAAPLRDMPTQRQEGRPRTKKADSAGKAAVAGGSPAPSASAGVAAAAASAAPLAAAAALSAEPHAATAPETTPPKAAAVSPATVAMDDTSTSSPGTTTVDTTEGSGSEASVQADDPRKFVKWEECLSDKKERYYWELATNHVQWELPTDGWVELIADDDKRYYWQAERDITQWEIPTSP